MVSTRQDAWSEEEDVILAEIVLSHIRKGSTQLQAFEEAGMKLKRTPAACGFRWNSNIRKKYTREIAVAKEEKKKRKEKQPTSTLTSLHLGEIEATNIDETVAFMQKIKQTFHLLNEYKTENVHLKAEINRLNQMNDEKTTKLEHTTKQLQKVSDEYHSLLSLLEQARKIAGNVTVTEQLVDIADDKK